MADTIYDNDELAQKLSGHITNISRKHMPAPVQIDIIDGSMQFVAGWGWGRMSDRNVRVILFGPYDLRLASAAMPYSIWALPPDSDSPSAPYIMIGVSWNGADGGRLPRIYGVVDDTLSYV